MIRQGPEIAAHPPGRIGILARQIFARVRQTGALRHGIAATVLLATLFGAAGCGETVIDDVKTEDAIEQNLESSLGKSVKSVDCPTGVQVEAGTSFECSVRLAGGKRETAKLKILNEDADVEVTGLEPVARSSDG